MAQNPNPLESLRTLLRLRTPQHVVAGGDPFVARRQTEIASGLDELLPDADAPDYKLAQLEGARRMGVTLPRADMKSSDLAELRRVLKFGQVEHGQALERATAPQRIAGEFNVRERELANRGALDVEKERSRGASERAQQQLAVYDRLAAAGVIPSRISSGGVSVSTGRTGQPRVPTQGQTGALQKSREAYGTGIVDRMLPEVLGGGKRKQAYLSALSDVLVRTGSYDWISQQAEAAQSEGLSAADAIAQAGEQGVQLDPYEQEYLKLVLGE